MTPEPILVAEGLTARYGARVALDGFDLRVARGEIFGILGPNGAGKSTAFQLLTGMRAPDGGRVLLGGISPEEPRARAALGVVFQLASLDQKLTARENLALAGALYGVTRVERGPRIDELLALVELDDRAGEPVGRWSEGMRRRLEIARALVHRPSLLVLDEPTRGLDEAVFVKIWSHLELLREREGLALVVITHRAEEAQRCDRLALLDGGRVVAAGTPAELVAKVGGDVIVLQGSDPESLAAQVRALGFEPLLAGGEVVLEQPAGHALIPRLVESLGPGRLDSVHLRRPTLADAFLHLTGHGLDRRAA